MENKSAKLSFRFVIFHFFLTSCLVGLTPALSAGDLQALESEIKLRAWGVPGETGSDAASLANWDVLTAFKKRFPNIKPYSPSGLEIPGRTMDIVPLMQIAGDIAPDVMYVNFRQSSTYIENKFLYPLDKYVEKAVGVDIKDGHLLALSDYIARLKQGPNYDSELSQERVMPQCWEVMRRRCPYGNDCPYVREWGGTPAESHQHIWCFPQMPAVVALFYRRDLFYEAGLPDRAPATMEEFLEWGRKLTNPKEERYGIKMGLDAWSTLAFLYSFGGKLMEKDEQGRWRCAFDSEEAVEAYYYVMRLFYEPFDNRWGHFEGIVYRGDEPYDTKPIAMHFDALGPITFSWEHFDASLWAYGSAPRGPTGKSGSEFNAQMTGIYAGLENNQKKRDAAWEYIRFYNGSEARQIRARVYVENGMGKFVHPSILRKAGYPEFAKLAPRGWEEAYRETVQNGVPEPYGENSQLIYSYATRAIDQIRTDDFVIQAIQKGDAIAAKNRIRQILKDRVDFSNKKMLNILTPQERSLRHHIALAVAVAILILFSLVFWNIFSTFAEKGVTQAGGWKSRQHKWAYIWMFPALASIAIWDYYPTAHGTVMAFQEYNVRGFSHWTGMDNFANVLFDQEFWYAMWVSLQYAFLSMLFGFGAPILLALLLSEVPRGKTLFRTIYYLPAVLSGVVVIFLWKSFYSPAGLLNQVVNPVIKLANLIPGVHLAIHSADWLNSPSSALFCCLLPTIWAGMGPGCLIYLAALKTIPEEIYEAADIDGAGIVKKVFYVALPSIRALISINFIGALIGVMKGGSAFVLAMTGGGPYTPNGQTEVVGLHIYWEAFAYLRFGPATAMGWILGSLLIGFTVLQLKRLRNMEFQTERA